MFVRFDVWWLIGVLVASLFGCCVCRCWCLRAGRSVGWLFVRLVVVVCMWCCVLACRLGVLFVGLTVVVVWCVACGCDDWMCVCLFDWRICVCCRGLAVWLVVFARGLLVGWSVVLMVCLFVVFVCR